MERSDSRVKKHPYMRNHNAVAEDDSGKDFSLNRSQILAPDPLLKKRGQATSLQLSSREPEDNA